MVARRISSTQDSTCASWTGFKFLVNFLTSYFAKSHSNTHIPFWLVSNTQCRDQPPKLLSMRFSAQRKITITGPMLSETRYLVKVKGNICACFVSDKFVVSRRNVQVSYTHVISRNIPLSVGQVSVHNLTNVPSLRSQNSETCRPDIKILPL